MLAIGLFDEPDCAEILQELSKGAEPHEKQSGTSQSNTVTCEADCQVTFSRSGESDGVSETSRQNSDKHCNTADEFDLLAQERMAHWTTYIAGLTGFGLFLLGFTLVEAFKATDAAITAAEATKAAAIDARRNAEAQVVFKGFTILLSSEKNLLYVECRLFNAGNTAAVEINTPSQINYMGVDVDGYPLKPNSPPDIPGKSDGGFSFWIPAVPIEAINDPKKLVGMSVHIDLDGKTVYGDTFRGRAFYTLTVPSGIPWDTPIEMTELHVVQPKIEKSEDKQTAASE